MLVSGCSLLLRRSAVRARTQQRIFMGKSELNNYVAKVGSTKPMYAILWRTGYELCVCVLCRPSSRRLISTHLLGGQMRTSKWRLRSLCSSRTCATNAILSS